MFIDFIQNLGTIPFQSTGPASFAQNGLLLEGSNAQFNQFLNGYHQNRQWGSWTQFINEWRLFSGYAASNPLVDVQSGPAFDGLVADLKTALKITAMTGGDFLHYKNSLSAAQFDEEMKHMADGLMTRLLNEFPYPTDGSGVSDTLFFDYLQESLTITAYLLNATAASTSIATYEALYNSLFSAGFQQRITAFISQISREHGFFLPSLFYDQWAQEITAEFKALQTEVLSPHEIKKRQITLDAFGLFLNMLSILQETVSTQAQILDYQANWQKEYTLCMQSTHFYIQTADGYANITLSNIAQTAKNALELDPSLTVDDLCIRFNNYHRPGGWGGTHNLVDGPSGAYVNLTSDWTNFAGPTLTATSPVPYTYQVFMEIAGTPVAWVADVDYLKGRHYTGESAHGGYMSGPHLIIKQRYQGSDPDDINVRSDKNNIMDQYIEGQRGKRSTINSRQQQGQNTVKNTNNSMDQIGSLMAAVMNQMSSMLQACFR